MLKTTDIDGKGLMVVQSAVWDNRRKVLPTVSRNVGVEGLLHLITHKDTPVFVMHF
jgi:hypothetical protein